MSLAQFLVPLAGDPSLAFRDRFSRADGATIGTADTGQPWTSHAGTWGPSSGRLALQTSTSNAVAWVDAGVPDGFILSADLTTSATADRTEASLLFRVADGSNFMGVTFFDLASVNAVRFIKRTAGAFAAINTINTAGTARYPTFVASTTYNVAIVVQFDMVLVLVNEAVVASRQISEADMTTFGSNTGVGVRLNPSSSVHDAQWDNIQMRTLDKLPWAPIDSKSPTLFRAEDATVITPGSPSDFREQDSIVYDPNDPNLSTHPERLYKLYHSNARVQFSTDGLAWGAPVGITGGPREDFSVVTILGSMGEVYRDGDGLMWMYGEETTTIGVYSSTDGLTWTEVSKTAIPVGGAAAWDEALVGSPTARPLPRRTPRP